MQGIYTYLAHKVRPEIGTFLGQLTDELTCQNVGCKGCQEGHWIVEFVSCSAKNYGYHLNTGEATCKVRIFTQLQSVPDTKFTFYERCITVLDEGK